VPICQSEAIRGITPFDSGTIKEEKMQSKKKHSVVFLCLLTALAMFLPACKSKENPSDISNHMADFYKGLEVKPKYSQSYVEQARGRYVFDPVLQGDIVKHDFIIKNDAKNILELSGAEGCCGCIVESYTSVIQPDQTGKISVLILTDSRGGSEINGTIKAKTNDKDRPEIAMDVSLYVKEFAALYPYRIWLEGSLKDEIVQRCIVVPNKDYPFHITGIKSRKNVWLDYSYREIKKDGEKAYEITVKNIRKKPGPYQEVLFVQTDNIARPEFKIRVEGRISP
jgi:hypothetical protein